MPPSFVGHSFGEIFQHLAAPPLRFVDTRARRMLLSRSCASGGRCLLSELQTRRVSVVAPRLHAKLRCIIPIEDLTFERFNVEVNALLLWKYTQPLSVVDVCLLQEGFEPTLCCASSNAQPPPMPQVRGVRPTARSGYAQCSRAVRVHGSQGGYGAAPGRQGVHPWEAAGALTDGNATGHEEERRRQFSWGLGYELSCLREATPPSFLIGGFMSFPTFRVCVAVLTCKFNNGGVRIEQAAGDGEQTRQVGKLGR